FIVLMKKALVKRDIGIISVASLGQGIKISEFSPEQISEKVKIGGSVKAHIAAMNLAIVALLFAIFFFFVVVIKSLCGNFVTGGLALVSGAGDICKAVQDIPGTSLA